MIQFLSHSGFSVHNLCSLAFTRLSCRSMSWDDGGSNVINMLITFFCVPFEKNN